MSTRIAEKIAEMLQGTLAEEMGSLFKLQVLARALLPETGARDGRETPRVLADDGIDRWLRRLRAVSMTDDIVIRQRIEIEAVIGSRLRAISDYAERIARTEQRVTNARRIQAEVAEILRELRQRPRIGMRKMPGIE